MLGIVPSYHCMQFEEKVMESKFEKRQKTSFQIQFWLVWPKFGPQFFFREFTSTRYQTLLQGITLNNLKDN